MHYRPGIEIVPGYRLQKLLGRGGFGEVWQAEGPGRVSAAVKIIDKVEEKAGRKEFRALKLIKDLRHPNLVSITGFWLKDADGTLLDSDAYIEESGSTDLRPSELIVAMDLCEKSLLDRLAECRKGLSEDTPGGIPLDELLEYMEAAAKAIDYLNVKHQIQHRDIKPHNIMIVGGSAQVCDFGLASTVSTARTSMGGAGSLAYMAPEVYSTKLPSTATDQYSLAITYCELRNGRLPLSDVESFAVLDDAKRKGMLDLSLLDERERGVIQRATSLDPAARFASCYEMVQELRRAFSTTFSASAPARSEPIAGYQLERSLRSRDGEEIWDAIDPDGLQVLLVVRNMHEAPATASWSTLSAVRDVSRSHPRLAEIYEFACLSATDKVLPTRLFKLPNPPMPAKTIVAGRRLSRNLSERLSSGGMPIKRLLLMMGDLAEGLDFLNAPQHDVGGKMVGFQHANLRPVNVLVDDDRAVLSNFAGVQRMDGDEQPFPAGKQIAESAFTPPEFAAGRITRWSDQYMLAVSYLQLRTGKPSASLSSSTGTSKQAGRGSRLEIAELKAQEREVLLRATDPDPHKRFATCCEFVAALGKAWDEIMAAEPPPPPASPKKRTSSSDAAAATIDASGVESASLSGLRDSAETALEPQPPPPAHGATLIPSATETRPPQDTNPEGQTVLSPPVVDAPRAPPKPPKRAGKPRPAVAEAPASARPWWRSRAAMIGGGIGGVAAVVLAIASLSGGPSGNGPSGNGSPTVRDEIYQLIEKSEFAAAAKAVGEHRKDLGDSAEELDGRVVEAWSKSIQQQARRGAEAGSSQVVRTAVDEGVRLVGAYVESPEARQALAAAADALIGLLRQQLAKAELADADAQRIAGDAEALVAALSTVKPVDDQRTAAAALVKARVACRRKDQDPASAAAAVAAVRPELLQDAGDKATWEALHALYDAKQSEDVPLLEGLLARHAKLLPPAELGRLRKYVQDRKSGIHEQRRAKWAALSAALRGKIDQGGPGLDEAFRQLTTLSSDAKQQEVWEYLNGGSDAAAYHEYLALRTLATLRKDGLGDDQYSNALGDLNGRIRDKVAEDASVLCAAALERVATIESQLKYDDQAKIAATRDMMKLAQSIATAAAGQFPAQAAEIRQALTDVDKNRVQAAMGELQRLRDAGDFAALARYSEGVKEIVGKSRPAAVLRTACAVECGVQDTNGTGASPADREYLRANQSRAADEDKLYVGFVAAISREESLLEQVAAAANAIDAAYSAPGGGNAWRERPARKKIAVARLKAAAQQHADGQIDRLAPPYYQPQSESAKSALRWLTTAVANCPAEDAQSLGELRQLGALASYYADPSDRAAAAKVADWTDNWLSSNAGAKAPLQVVLVNALCHQVGGQLSPAAVAFARLFDACRAAPAESAPKVYEIDAQVLAPVVTMLESGTLSGLSEDGKRAAARLLAARGRFAHLHASVAARIRAELAAPMKIWTAAMLPVAQVLGPSDLEAADVSISVSARSLDWFDAAVKLDPTQAAYYCGRGIACDLHPDMPFAERAQRMAADAAEALKPGRQPKDFPAAYGLRGLGLYYTAVTIVGYDKQREILRQADQDLSIAVAGCEKLAASPAGAAYPDVAADRDLLKVTRGHVLVLLANYETDLATKEERLEEAVRLGLSVTRDATLESKAKYVDGIQPEYAYHMVGNALEDFGWLLGRPEYYPLAMVQFSKAEDVALQLKNPLGANLSRYYRGRCQYKLATTGYLAAAGVLEGAAGADANAKAAAAKAAGELRKLGEAALKSGEQEIRSYIDEAGRSEEELAEAHAFMASIRLALAEFGISQGDEYTACMAAFAAAEQAARRNAYSPIDRQQFLLDRADAAMFFAADAKKKSLPQEANDRYAAAQSFAKTLAEDDKAHPVMRAKGYGMAAKILVMQETKPGQSREDVLAALSRAIELAGQAKSEEGDEAAAVSYAIRGEYNVGIARQVKPLGAPEHDLIFGAAGDFYATIAEPAPLSESRMQNANSLSIVLEALNNSTVNYPQKATFVKEKDKYAKRIVDVACQIADEYAARFDRQRKIAAAAVATELVRNAAKWTTDAGRKQQLAAAGKTIAAARNAAIQETQTSIVKMAKWRDLAPVLEKYLPPKP